MGRQRAQRRPTTHEATRPDQARDAEKTRKAIKDLAEKPPAKTMAEVTAASEVLEAAAREKDAQPVKQAKKSAD